MKRFIKNFSLASLLISTVLMVTHHSQEKLRLDQEAVRLAEQKSLNRPDPQTRIDEVIRGLEVERQKLGCEKRGGGGCENLDGLLQNLRKGSRGDGLRHSWMDKLNELGIKQVEFNFRFSWHSDGVRFKFSDITYFRQYYVQESKVDGKLLSRIKQQRLEQELKEFVVAYLKSRYGEYQKGNVKEGDDNLTLFEDESLPVMSWVY